MAARAWTLFEVEAIVADYLDMLAAELRGERPNKTDHRNALMPKLGGRSKGSVERKHMNISAVMIDLGYPYIDGYKPYVNYQRALLPDVVLEQVESNAEIQALVESQVSGPIVDEPDLEDILAAMVERPLVPARRQRVGEAEREYVPQKPTKVNYLAREARNRALGGAGERFVLKYERARLIAAGKESLAQDVEHTASCDLDPSLYRARLAG